VVKKCANPACSASFRRLGQGRLFAFDARSLASRGAVNFPPVARATSLFFWLCENCSLTMTPAVDPNGGLILHELTERATAANVTDDLQPATDQRLVAV